MTFRFDDGGRAAAGFKGSTRDCVTRAIAIATALPYREVYDALHKRQRDYLARTRSRSRAKRRPSPREGVFREVYEPYLFDLGWIWYPTMKIGSGCQVHLVSHELPMGPVIARLSRHLTAVIDGEIRDTFDPSRDGTRCVYGWFEPATFDAPHAPSVVG